MDKRPSIIGRMFDRIAPTYDLLNTILSFSLDKAWRRAAIDLLEIRAGETVLDIATGTGDLAILAAQGGGTVIGIDLSRKMLLRALGKAHEQGLRTWYSVIQGDALSMPFRNETFNSAMVAFGIRNMNHLEACLAEINRVLKPPSAGPTAGNPGSISPPSLIKPIGSRSRRSLCIRPVYPFL